MKTATISAILKSDLLIVELPEGCNFIMLNKAKVFQYETLLCDNTVLNRLEHIRIPEGSYTILGKPDEIREEDAKKLVEYFPEILGYQNFKDDDEYYKETATESLLSALESEIFWVNPVKLENIVLDDGTELNSKFKTKEYDAAELRTFDRSRTLIFVKN